MVCRLRTTLAMAAKTCVGASLAHMCLISVKRYLAVRSPSRYNVLLTKRRTAAAVSLLWLISTVYSVVPFVGYPEVGNLAGLAALVALFVVVTAGCYIGTFAKLEANSARINLQRGSSVAPANRWCQTPSKLGEGLGQLSAAASRRKKKEKRLARTMLITVGILAFCYLPGILAYSLLARKGDKMEVNWIIQRWCDTSFYLNSFVNPFWYCWRILHLRKAVRKLLRFGEREMLDENQQPENRVAGRLANFPNRNPKFSERHSVTPASALRRRGGVEGLPIEIIVTPVRRASMPQPQLHEQGPAKKRSNST